MSERNCVMHGALEVNWHTEDVPDLDGEPRCYVCELEARIEKADCEAKDPYKVVIKHTDPGEIKTAEALKYRQRARAAEEALKVSADWNTRLYNSLHSVLRSVAGLSSYEIEHGYENHTRCEILSDFGELGKSNIDNAIELFVQIKESAE